MTEEELEDLIENAIMESIDMDWVPRDGARAVFRVLYTEGLLPLTDDDQAKINAAWEIHKAAGPDDHPNATDYRNRAERAEAELAEVRAEVERLRQALVKANDAHWFYYGNDCSSDQCRDSIDECISEDFEWDNKPAGDHLLQISGAKPVPDMWVALHYFTEAEKDERDDDEPYSYTVHPTEEAARAALNGGNHD